MAESRGHQEKETVERVDEMLGILGKPGLFLALKHEVHLRTQPFGLLYLITIGMLSIKKNRPSTYNLVDWGCMQPTVIHTRMT